MVKAIREIHDVKSGEIVVSLPEDFNAKRVEIIILPVDETSVEKQSLRDLLLTAPTLSEDDLRQFEEVRGLMSKWSVKDY